MFDVKDSFVPPQLSSSKSDASSDSVDFFPRFASFGLGCVLVTPSIISSSFLFFPLADVKSMSLIGRYSTFF